MTLLGDLKAIKLDGIINARASIKASVNGSELTGLLSGGAAKVALGELGGLLHDLQSGDPAQLVKPIADALEKLTGQLRPEGLPVDKFLDAVKQASSILAGLLSALDGDPADLGKAFGTSLGGALDQLKSGMGLGKLGDGLGELRRIVDLVDGGLPRDSSALAEIFVEVLVPLPKATLTGLRALATHVATGSAAISLSPERTSGLADALDAVAAAANLKDAVKLQAALQALEVARLGTLGSLRDELDAALALVRQLDPTPLVEPLLAADRDLRGATRGLLEFLDELGGLFRTARARIDSFDPQLLADALPAALQVLENIVSDGVNALVDALVQRAVDWLRGLFSHLPFSVLRAELSAFFHKLAKAITDADVGRYAREAHDALDKIRTLVSPAGLSAAVQAALKKVDQEVGKALDGVIGALDQVKQEIDKLTDGAEAVLNKALPAVTQFNAAVVEIQAGVGKLGISPAGQKIVDDLDKLRQAAEKLLTVAPLPEPLRGQVDQIVSVVRGIDLDAAFAPVRASAAQLKLPDDVALHIDDGLKETVKLVENLLPTAVIEGIHADVQEAFDKIAGFNPLKLLPDLSGFLGTAADHVEKLEPPPALAAELHAGFARVLEAIDAVRPLTLLAPAIDAYDGLLSNISLPDTGSVVDKVTSLFSSVGNQAGQALGGAATPSGSSGGASSGGASSGGASSGGASSGGASSGGASSGGASSGGASSGGTSREAGSLPPSDLRPGDIVRLFGWLPRKLREALAALDAGAAGDALRAIDALTGALARDLRALQGLLWQIDARLESGFDALLAPLAQRQLTAQLAVRANFSGSSFDVSSAMHAVALAGPGAIRASLAEPAARARAQARECAAALARTGGNLLGRTADALEACQLTRLSGDLGGLLAALDPEPLAAEMDALVGALLAKLPSLLETAGAALADAISRLRDLVRNFNPGVQAHKLLKLLDVLKEQLDLFSPRRLAVELGEIHAAVRATIAAYDPGAFLDDLSATVKEIADSLRKLDPAQLAGDTGFLTATIDRLKQADPTAQLADVGHKLDAFGDQVAAIDLKALTDSISALPAQIVDDFEQAAELIKQEIVALLESLHYANASVSAQVTVEAKA
jgi:putative NIF3 family GTP cyclohydrolase 1 type 2